MSEDKKYQCNYVSIMVDEDTRNELNKIKYDKKVKRINEVIKLLLERFKKNENNN